MVVQRLTDLLFKPVIAADGKRLGHVFDVYCRVEGTRCLIRELMFGTHGLLESVGLREPDIKRVTWDQVSEVDEYAVRLRPDARITTADGD